MAPIAVSTEAQAPEVHAKGLSKNSMKTYPPLKSKHTLDQYKQVQLTPVMGTEFKNVDLAELLRAPNSDDLIRDLSVVVAQRGVCFFRNQGNVDKKMQKELGLRLHQLSGMPPETGFYRHSLKAMQGEDPEMGKVDPDRLNKMYIAKETGLPRQTATREWHTDSSFEPNSPDFTILKMTALPETGGDTLWASGYEMYERLSPPYKRFFESLTATHKSTGLHGAAMENPDQMDHGPRGGPNNVGVDFESHHPVVRTHPITGWKSLFASGTNCLKIDDVTQAESDELMSKIMRLYLDNHEVTIRFHWDSEQDLAIWDNRCTFHAATSDHFGKGTRIGWRCMTMGEVPFYDPNSKSRNEATGGWPYKVQD